jgi:hypothetical protein
MDSNEIAFKLDQLSKKRKEVPKAASDSQPNEPVTFRSPIKEE